MSIQRYDLVDGSMTTTPDGDFVPWDVYEKEHELRLYFEEQLRQTRLARYGGNN